MPLPQAIVRDVGGTIDIVLPERWDGATTPTVTVCGPDGTAYVSAANATADTVSTTISAGAAIGASSVTVASATGITPGRTYLLGTAASELTEHVRVRAVASTTVYLYGPTLYAHASGVGFVGTRLSYAVTSAQATTLFARGWAVWTYTVSSASKTAHTAVECVLKTVRRMASVADWQLRVPQLYYRLDGVNADALLQSAFEDVLSSVEPRYRVRTTIGDEAWSVPTIYRASEVMAAEWGADWAPQRDYYRAEWTRQVAEAVKNFPVDNDEDGSVTAIEGGYHSIRFARSG